MSGVSSVGAKALAAWTWCQDDSSEHKSSKADGLFPKKCPTLLPQSPGSQENRCYHPGMEMSVAGFLPRSLKNLGSTLPFLLVLSGPQIQYNVAVQWNSFGVRPG